jgi:hypothetical protein
MRRTTGLFLTASLAIHVGLGVGGAWVGKHARDVHDDPKPALAGETFDIARLEQPPIEQQTEQPDPDEQTEVGIGLGTRVTIPRAATTRVAPVAPLDVPLTYGAVGDRSASSILVTLARGFPQAASTDGIWRTVPFGDAGSATMEIELSEDGTVARWSVGPGASLALRQAMVRTMSLVGGRPFIARGPTTKLHIEARVTADAVRDGDDAVYAIHSEHEGDKASAYFSLTSGRRVDLVITTVK